MAHVQARAGYGPQASAQPANLAIGHHIPVYRATLLCQLAGIAVSAGCSSESCRDLLGQERWH